MTVSTDKFERIAKLVGDPNTPSARPSTRAEKLQLYGLYKRATIDTDQRPERPGMFNIDGRMKWDAWKAEDGKSKEEAMQAYVDLAKELVGKLVEDILAE
jgi:diazepam-binding inhibitor (GABA receptor modulating acyl-CoA-binding protein)